MQRTLTRVPDVPIGAIFNPRRGFLSVVIPLERTNLILNPSVEFDSTGYTAVGGSIARSTAQQYHGAYSVAVTPSAGSNSDGVFYGSVSLTASTAYAYSCKFRGAAGKQYKISIATTGGSDLTAVTFTATGRWQWVYGFWNETSSTSRRFYIRKNAHSDASVFYVDGLQIESLSDGVLAPTTYIDGDQAGLLPNQFPPPFKWNGTAHASTSTRLISTAAGGYVRNLDYYRYKVLAYLGLGITAVANVATVGAGADGAQYQTTVAQSRQFSINGFWDAETPYALDQFRTGLYDALGPDHASPRQPAVLFYQPFDDDDEMGAMGRIVAGYERGLEQTATPVPRETAPISFTQFLPSITIGDQGALLTEALQIANANYIAQRSPLGVWSAMGTGGAGAVSDGVRAIVVAPNGRVYVGGDFTSMGGVANTDGIAYWDPATATWNAMGTGISSGTNRVRAIAIAPNGTDVYVGGDFSLMGGVANTVRIARWDGAAWNALSTGANDIVESLAIGPTGIVYVGGNFTTIGGVGITRIAQWSGSAFSAVGGAANGNVHALTIGRDGYLYAAGSFSTINAVTVNGTGKWDGSAWTALGDGPTGGAGDIFALAAGPNGAIYAGGSFTGTTNYAAVWNGTGWSQLGTLNNSVFALHYGTDGILRAGGAFTVADGITLNDSLAYWNGATWVPPDIAVPGTATFRAITMAPDGTLYVGNDTTATAVTSAVTTVTNTGTMRAYPTLLMPGPVSSPGSPLYHLINYTNGKALYFTYTLSVGEIVSIRTSPHSVSLFSTFRGDVSTAILRGSSPDFALEKGTNYISLHMGKALTAQPALSWPISLQSVSDLVAR